MYIYIYIYIYFIMKFSYSNRVGINFKVIVETLVSH